MTAGTAVFRVSWFTGFTPPNTNTKGEMKTRPFAMPPLLKLRQAISFGAAGRRASDYLAER